MEQGFQTHLNGDRQYQERIYGSNTVHIIILMIPGIILPIGKVKYHRPVRLHAARPGVGRMTGGMLPGTTPCPVPALSSAGANAPSGLDTVA